MQKRVLSQEARQFGVDVRLKTKMMRELMLDCVEKAALPQLSSRSQEQFLWLPENH